MNSVFVTGTDTEVGKTRISLAWVELLQRQGQTVGVMKPIASGCETTGAGLRNDDAKQLQQQASIKLPYEVINPYAFAPAIAPHIAAQQANITMDLAHIQQQFNIINQQSDVVVVEGAGGWLVPVNDKETLADLAKLLALPVLLVVSIRLGCINHALLTAQAISATGLPLHGWVANHLAESAESTAIITTLTERIAAPCLGIIPPLSPRQSAIDFLHC